jgi:carboxyl-terminal processing protease
MRICITSLFILLLLSAGAVRAAEAPPDGGEKKQDFDAVVSAVIKPLAGAKAGDPVVWQGAEKVRALGKDALPAIRAAAAKQQPIPVRLALGWALLALKDADAGIKTLSAVVSDKKAGRTARANAARALGELGKYGAEVEVTRLLDAVDDEIVKVALAGSLMLAATSEQAESKATTALVRLSRAGKGEVQAAAALALAEFDDFRDPVPAVLKKLSLEPTGRGRLAAKLLQFKRMSEAMLQADNYKGSLGRPLLDEVKRLIIKSHVEPPRKDAELVHAAARGMAAALHKTDPYSTYMSPESWKGFREQISGTYGGIGAHVMFLRDDRSGEKMFTVVKPIYTGPAYKAGVRSYDRIVEIDGVSIKGKTSDDLRDMLRGLPKSVVACKVRRRGLKKDKEFLVKIVRGSINMPSVYFELFPGGIGYLRLESFGDTSTREVEAALQALEKKGMKALVFDMRGNPGGLLRAARDIADKFLKDDKLIVYSEGRDKEIAARRELRTTDEATHPDYPIVTLVDGGTASAAEIVSGAFQDHKRSVLIGQRTFGKGSVQQLMRLDAAARRAILKLTIAKYYLPSGRSIHRSKGHRGGIMPDIAVVFEPTLSRESHEKHRAAGDFWRYSLAHWPKHKEKLMELARFDNRDPAAYPGFDEWYKALKVKTDRDSARRVLRQWLRRLTSDDRGADWAADLQEDNQLQRAVYEAGRKIKGLDMAAVPEYKWFVGKLAKAAAPKEKGAAKP